jgi:hypothetical protein
VRVPSAITGLLIYKTTSAEISPGFVQHASCHEVLSILIRSPYPLHCETRRARVRAPRQHQANSRHVALDPRPQRPAAARQPDNSTYPAP